VAFTSKEKDMALKITLWAIPVIFGAGAFYQMMVSDGSAMSDVRESVEEQHDAFQAHEKADGHPITLTHIGHLTVQQDEILTEQRVMRVEQIEQRVDLAAICQATGADCR